MTKLGKIWQESRPQGSHPAGLMPAAFWSKSRSGLSHGPKSPLRVMRSIGFSMLSANVQGWMPAVLTKRCGPSMVYAGASKPACCAAADQSGGVCFACRTGAW